MKKFHIKKKEIELDSSILEDPIVKELAKYPFKEFDEFTDKRPIGDRHSSSGKFGNLVKLKINKENNSVSYYKKKFTHGKIIDLTKSSLSLQELIAGQLYRITGCRAPKQKIFVKKDQNELMYAPRVDAGSKSLEITQIQDKEHLGEYIDNWATEKNWKALKELSRLMGAVLAIGDYDRNPANYYYDKKDNLFGKMDHDRTFTLPINDFKAYADPNFVMHVYFIEALCNTNSSTNTILMNKTNNLNDNIRPFERNSRYADFKDGLFNLDREKGYWFYNYDFLNNKIMDQLKEYPTDCFMFVSYLKSVKNFTDMPQEIKEHIFNPENLLGDIWGNLHEDTQEDLKVHSEKLLNKFEDNLEDLRLIIELPLQKLNELETQLFINNVPIPKVSVNYEAAVDFITTARKNNMTLHKLKEYIKNGNTLDKNKGFESSRDNR